MFKGQAAIDAIALTLAGSDERRAWLRHTEAQAHQSAIESGFDTETTHANIRRIFRKIAARVVQLELHAADPSGRLN